MKLRISILFAFLTIAMLNSCNKKCETPYPEGKHLINTDEDGNNIAMEGYDLLTFFDNKPRKGNTDITSIHNGIKYLFVSETNKVSFDVAPMKYLPMYGGFCAVAASFGNAEELQTYDLYEVVDDKLYFQKNKKANNLWKKDPQKVIDRANNSWNCIVDDLGLNISDNYKEPEEIK